ncbi:MAG TPA: HAD-IA family hydrolase [Gammaproteobacteria bacterium]|nr:HAD-IA family hydrolase [Gammaproteobacteria bacterium]
MIRPYLVIFDCDGVRAALMTIDVPICVVSNGPVEKMRTTLGVTGLLPMFEGRLFSPDLGLPGKPEPDLFLAAARSARVEPARCVVIEDSPGGVHGAHAAGMQALGFTGLAHIDAAALVAAGARTFAHMDELNALLAVNGSPGGPQGRRRAQP